MTGTLGSLAAFLGGVSLIKPLKFLKICSRRQGILALGLGAVAVVAGFALPTKQRRIAAPRTQLDRFAPLYESNEVHFIRVAALRDRVYRAIKMVTADQIALFRTLTWIRRGGRRGPASILNPTEHVPLLEVVTSTGFVVLAEDLGQEIVIGNTVKVPPEFRAPSLR